MWIKTTLGKLVNLENLAAVATSSTGNQLNVVVLTLAVTGLQIPVKFETEKEAAEYIDKLAEKLGAVDI